MPTNIAIKHHARSAPAHRAAFGFARFGTARIVLAVWAITVLLMGTIASFDTRPKFLADFDVSVAAF